MPQQNLIKKALRQQILTKLSTLPQQYLTRSNQAILANLLSLNALQQAKTIFCYVSVNHEIETRMLINHLLAQGKRVCVPKCHNSRQMDVYQIHSLDDLELGKYQIPAPKIDCKLISPAMIDVGIIPCVTGSITGKRLGYGNGFYDLYFERGDFLKVMPCRDELLTAEIPIEPWDKNVDVVVTENQVYCCNQN